MAEQTGITIRPAFIFWPALALSLGLGWVVPLTLGGGLWQTLAGFVVLVPALAVQPLIHRTFERDGNEYDVRKSPNRLIVEGAFRYSRNPGYVANLLLGLGLGLAIDNMWLIASMPAVALILHFGVVLPEERHLEKRFGEAYLDYKRRVRRWL